MPLDKLIEAAELAEMDCGLSFTDPAEDMACEPRVFASDRWEKWAVQAGITPALAALGRAVIREA